MDKDVILSDQQNDFIHSYDDYHFTVNVAFIISDYCGLGEEF